MFSKRGMAPQYFWRMGPSSGRIALSQEPPIICSPQRRGGRWWCGIARKSNANRRGPRTPKIFSKFWMFRQIVYGTCCDVMCVVFRCNGAFLHVSSDYVLRVVVPTVFPNIKPSSQPCRSKATSVCHWLATNSGTLRRHHVERDWLLHRVYAYNISALCGIVWRWSIYRATWRPSRNKLSHVDDIAIDNLTIEACKQFIGNGTTLWFQPWMFTPTDHLPSRPPSPDWDKSARKRARVAERTAAGKLPRHRRGGGQTWAAKARMALFVSLDVTCACCNATLCFRSVLHRAPSVWELRQSEPYSVVLCVAICIRVCNVRFCCCNRSGVMPVKRGCLCCCIAWWRGTNQHVPLCEGTRDVLQASHVQYWSSWIWSTFP